MPTRRRPRTARARPRRRRRTGCRRVQQFPESVEIAEVAKEVEAALAGPETTGAISGVRDTLTEARQLEEQGRVREAPRVRRGVRPLPNDERRAGEARTAERVEKAGTRFRRGR
jgi:hypothetical protein